MIVNMRERDIKNFAISTCNFVIFRFPFWDALSTAMLLGEKEANERKLPFPREFAYIHIGLLFILATCMVFYNSQRWHCSVIASVQVLAAAVIQVMFWQTKGWLVNMRIMSRSLGVCFSYMAAGSFYSTSVGSKQWKITFILLAGTLSTEGYLLLTDPVEESLLHTSSLLKYLPFKKLAHYVISILLALCVACLLSLKNIKHALKCTIAIWIVMLAVDMNIHKWSKFTDLWTQYRIIGSDICIVGSCILLYCRIVE